MQDEMHHLNMRVTVRCDVTGKRYLGMMFSEKPLHTFPDHA
jgi:hypothetical protein